MGYLVSSDMQFKFKRTISFVKDNWLMMLLALGILIVLWNTGGEVQPVSNMNQVPINQMNWFQPIPLR